MAADRKSNICADAETSVLIQRWDDLRRRAGEAHPLVKKKKEIQLPFVMRGTKLSRFKQSRKKGTFFLLQLLMYDLFMVLI